MSYLRYFVLVAQCGVHHILCCVLFYHMLPVSMDYPFLIASLVFS